MATLKELVEAGILREHFPDLESWEMPERHLYCTKEFDTWMENELKIAARVRGRNLTPWEFVEQLFFDYVLGRPLTYSVGYRKLEPLGQHIWELKATDVRIFGWFVRKRHFVATGGEFKDKLSKEKQKIPTNVLYKPFIDGAVRHREKLALDEPKLITSMKYHDVF